jgi:cardiolipin synthase A/B
VPDDFSAAGLVAAARRGVEITVLVPGEHNDSRVALRASQRSWQRLLEAGVRIHVYRPCRLHWKVMIVDDWWVSVGSTNFDNRSFRLNDEANLNVYDAQFAAEQVRQFELDLQASHRVTAGQWRRRPAARRLSEAAADLARSQL